jgi:hypothetical protein
MVEKIFTDDDFRIPECEGKSVMMEEHEATTTPMDNFGLFTAH